MGIRKTVNDYITDCAVVHRDKYDYSLWTDPIRTADRVDIICPVHGKFTQRLNDHKRGNGCPDCGRSIQSTANKKSLDHYLALCKKAHGNKYDYSLLPTEIHRHQKVDIICPIHGKFTQLLNSHINNSGCRECGDISTNESRTKGKPHIVKMSVKSHGNKYNYDLIPVNAKTTDIIPIVCPTHGTFWQRANSHMMGHTCSKCGLETRLPETALIALNDKEWLEQKHLDERWTLGKIANELNVDRATVSKYMKKLDIVVNDSYYQSVAEIEIRDFIKSLEVNVESNNRSVLNGQELDIYLPDLKLAIEYNGLYWHCEVNKEEEYHLNKTELCEEKGIRLIHIFEDEWHNQKQQCKDTLTHLVGKSEKGIYARNCQIREISWKVAKQFLNQHHLLGAGTPGNFRIGAFSPSGQLIGVMVFGNQNNEHSGNSTVELKRFVTDKNNNPGVGSKMFKWAISNKNYTEIIAFVDRRWFIGLVKNHIGFSLNSTTKPAIWWTDGTSRFHRRFETKQTLLKKFPEFDSSMTKRQMLASLGYYRIFDCGKLKLKWNKN